MPNLPSGVTLCSVKAATELGGIAGPLTTAPLAVGRPPRGATRFWVAYLVTFRIVLSYLSLRFQARFRSANAIERIARKKHLRNARRIHRTIARLQGLFIKV